MTLPRRFVGCRIREAREARDLTATSLSELLGISKQAVSKYETGALDPSPEMIRRLGEVLQMPQHYFFQPVEPHEEQGLLFWRSTSAATKRARVRASRRFGWLRSVTRYLSRFVEFPGLHFPSLDLPSDPTKITDAMVEAAATDARRFWNLGDGPISNVSWLLENNGAVVARSDFDASHLDAFSEWKEQRHPYVVMASDKNSAARSRFDAAHELGHLLMHRQVSDRQFNTKATHSVMERQADCFASAFLMPAATFSECFYSTSIDALIPIKSQWQVSIGAMISRAAQLNLVSSDEERRMWINLSRRNWRKREPLDDELVPEQPRFLKRALDLVLSSKIVAPGELVVHLGLPERVIEEVIGVPDGYISTRECGLRLKEDGPAILRFPGVAQ